MKPDIKLVPEKKICAVHDISCAGRCSLTVILPVVSAAGIECNVIPTAVLSTHTGEFTGYTFRNLSDDIMPVAQHWHELGREYDAVYTGFFGSAEQIDMAERLPELLGKKSGCILMVDPVMADAGRLYTGFDMKFVDRMREYCRKADIIVPNITEASLLLEKEYNPGPHREEEIRSMLKALTDMGPSKAIITGVVSENRESGAAYFDKTTGETGMIMKKIIPGRYYGTGDLFAAALLSGILNEKGIEEACKIALNIVHKSIKRTYKLGSDVRYGVEFEHYLRDFSKEVR